MGDMYLARNSRLDRNVAIKPISQNGELRGARQVATPYRLHWYAPRSLARVVAGAPEIRLRASDPGWERVLVSAKDSKTVSVDDVAFAAHGHSFAYRRVAEERRYASGLDPSAANPRCEQPAPMESSALLPGRPMGRSGHEAVMKVRVGSGNKPVLVAQDAGEYPLWSPRGDVIACRIPGPGFNLISSDGKQQRRAGSGTWYGAAWTGDGSALIGLKRTEEGKLALVSLNAASGVEQVFSDLGRVPPALRTRARSASTRSAASASHRTAARCCTPPSKREAMCGS